MPERYDIPEETLRELYLEEKLSIQECADHYGCSSTLIEFRLDRYGIPTRPPGSERIGISEDELFELYVEAGLTTVEIAERYDCDPTVIERRLRWYGIETRHTTAGEGEWQYKYGSNWRKERKKALERANYRCEICGITDGEHRVKYVDPTREVRFGLDVQHRMSARRFERWRPASIEDANSQSNLQVLCQACHFGHGDRVGTSDQRT